MELPNETTRNNNAIFGFAWAFTWRALILAIIFSLLFKIIPVGIKQELGFIYQVFYLLGLLSIYWFTSHWLLQRGFGSTKIILMEHVDYQKLIKTIEKNEHL